MRASVLSVNSKFSLSLAVRRSHGLDEVHRAACLQIADGFEKRRSVRRLDIRRVLFDEASELQLRHQLAAHLAPDFPFLGERQLQRRLVCHERRLFLGVVVDRGNNQALLHICEQKRFVALEPVQVLDQRVRVLQGDRLTDALGDEDWL